MIVTALLIAGYFILWEIFRAEREAAEPRHSIFCYRACREVKTCSC